MSDLMLLLRRADAWLGKRVFHAPIIWICQRAGITQWAFYRYGWWLYMLWAIWNDDHHSVLVTAFLVFIGLVRTFSAGLALNRPVHSSLLLRYFEWAILVIISIPPLSRHDLQAIAWQLVVLAAEYATTIRTIPPRKRQEPVRRREEVWA